MGISRFPLCNGLFQINEAVHGCYNHYSTHTGDLGTLKKEFVKDDI